MQVYVTVQTGLAGLSDICVHISSLSSKEAQTYFSENSVHIEKSCDKSEVHPETQHWGQNTNRPRNNSGNYQAREATFVARSPECHAAERDHVDKVTAAGLQAPECRITLVFNA